jgi:hypothetical protein
VDCTQGASDAANAPPGASHAAAGDAFGDIGEPSEDRIMSEAIATVDLPLPAPNDDLCRTCGESAPEMIFTGGARGTVFCPRCFGSSEPKTPEGDRE